MATTALAGAMLIAHEARAQDASWLLNPGSGDFNTDANWNPGTVPTGTAFFGNTNQPNVSFSEPLTTIGGWTFNAGSPAYNFTNGEIVRFTGAGIVINGGSVLIDNIGTLEFRNDSTAGAATIENFGSLTFFDTSGAGNAVIINDGAASAFFRGTSSAEDASITNFGDLFFHENSSAGNATIVNSGDVFFTGNATAAGATITNDGYMQFIGGTTAGAATITNNDTLEFWQTSSGGEAQIINDSPGVVDISNLDSGGTTFGSIEGSGSFVLGAKNLTTGSNDMSTEVSGVISGVGGSLTKVGTGTLTLTGANTFTGQLAIGEGRLTVHHAGGNALADVVVVDVASDAEFEVRTSEVIGGLTGEGWVGGVSGSERDLTIRALADYLFAGDIESDLLGLIKEGTATQAITGDITIGGDIEVDEGTLALSGNNSVSRIDVANGARLRLESDGAAGGGGVWVNQGGTVSYGDGVDNGTSVLLNFQGGAGIVNLEVLDDDVAEQSGLLSGPVNPSIGIEKIGTGTLILSSGGDIPVYGGATVAEGTLLVNGFLGNSNMTVESGATVGGTGTLGATTVQSGATFAPGVDGIGTLNVSGNLTFEAGSTFQVEVDPTGASSDLALVTGQAFLNGGTVVHVGLDGAYQPFSTYTILTATGGVNGEFGDVTSDFAFLTPLLDYDANNVYLQLARNDVDFGSIGDTFNRSNTGQGVESLGFGNPLYDAILVLGEDQARAAFDSLSGEIHPSIAGMLVDDSRYLREAVAARMGMAAFDSAAPTPLAFGPGAEPLTGEAERYGFWASAFGSWGKRDSDGNAAEFERSTGGLFVGSDIALAGDWRLGALAGYGRSSFDEDDRASSGSADSVHLGLYGGTRRGPLNVHFGAAYSWHDIETARLASFPGFEETLSADYDASTAQAFGEVSYRFGAPESFVEPFAGLAYVAVRTDGFTESGGAAALSVASENTDATFTTLGLRASNDMTIGGRKATAHSAVGWRHAFGDDTAVFTHAFAGGDPFLIAGTPIAEDAAVIEAGLDLALSVTASLGLAYSGQVGDGVSDHGVRADFALGF